MSSFHGVIAWCLLLATLLWSVKTRSSLSQQLAEMRQFSSASESETFEKMSRMTKQIADKNKEIGDLNKTQRANQRTIADLQTQKTALEANLQAAKEETVRCTQREVRFLICDFRQLHEADGPRPTHASPITLCPQASLQTELSDCKLGCEKELDSHGEVHRSKDAEIEELKRQVQILVDQAQKNAERVPSSTDNGQQEQKKEQKKEQKMEQKKEQKMEQKKEQKKEQQGQMEPPTPPGQMETDNVQVRVFFCISVY